MKESFDLTNGIGDVEAAMAGDRAVSDELYKHDVARRPDGLTLCSTNTSQLWRIASSSISDQQVVIHTAAIMTRHVRRETANLKQ